MRSIDSRHNPAVRLFRALAESPDPDGTRLLLDGAHLVAEARRAGLRFEMAAVARALLATPTEAGALARALERDGVDVVDAADDVLRAMSPVRTPSGIVAIAHRQPVAATGVCGAADAFVLAAVDVQDPGNLGSLLRAAEAGGVSGVIVCGGSAHPFSWKALRGSMGSALRLPIATGLSPDAALDTLKGAGLRTIAAVPRGGAEPDRIGWTGRVALFLGGEGPGLPAAVAARCDERVSIPMAPPVESLNVAVAGAILIYAGRRQRTAAAPLVR